MDEKKVVGRKSSSVTVCNLQEDGYWKVVSEIVDDVLFEGDKDWTSEKVEAMAIDKDCSAAIRTSMNSTLGFILDNVYKNGFPGLVEYRAYERQLNASKTESIQNS